MGAGDMKTAVQCKKCGKSYSAGVVNGDFQGLCPSCVAAFAFEEISQSPLEAAPPSPVQVHVEIGPDGGRAIAAPVTPPPDYEKTTMYLKPGTQFQGVVIESVLGQGGMGVVYKARQVGLDRPVALKVMSDRLAGDAEFVKRFEKEAKAMAALSHANIVAVFNYGIDNGRCFIVMEYVDGVNLRQILREKKLKPEEGLKIVPQLCDALEYAHGEGVVHRDIKPENILIDKKGRVKITDFGLAKMVDPERHDHTVTGLVMGTPHYMAPEQVESPKAVDHRADIYSMGVVFYELLTGELPIGRWQLPSQKNGVDARLDQVVLRALEREPERRYQHASDMKVEVSRVSEFIPVARLASASAVRLGPQGSFSPPGVVSAPSPAGVNVASPASPSAGWTAPAGLAPVRPNTPLQTSHVSGWVGTGFGLTIAAVALAFVGVIVAGASSGATSIPALVATLGLGGVLGAFGFLCTTIGVFDILFNAGRRHGFGLAVMSYATDLLLLGLVGVTFFMVQRPEAVSTGRKLLPPSGAATPITASGVLFTTPPVVPAGWSLSAESRTYQGADDLALFWRISGLAENPSVRRARRIVYVTGLEGGLLAVNILEGADAAQWSQKARESGDVIVTREGVVVLQKINEQTPMAPGKVNEVRAWVTDTAARGGGR